MIRNSASRMMICGIVARIGCGSSDDAAGLNGESESESEVEAAAVATQRWIVVASEADGYSTSSHVCPTETWWYERFDLAGTVIEFDPDGRFSYEPVSDIDAALSATCDGADCAALQDALKAHVDVTSATCEPANPGCLCRYVRVEQPAQGTWTQTGDIIEITPDGAQHPGPIEVVVGPGVDTDEIFYFGRGTTLLMQFDVDRI